MRWWPACAWIGRCRAGIGDWGLGIRRASTDADGGVCRTRRFHSTRVADRHDAGGQQQDRRNRDSGDPAWLTKHRPSGSREAKDGAGTMHSQFPTTAMRCRSLHRATSRPSRQSGVPRSTAKQHAPKRTTPRHAGASCVSSVSLRSHADAPVRRRMRERNRWPANRDPFDSVQVRIPGAGAMTLPTDTGCLAVRADAIGRYRGVLSEFPDTRR